MGQRRAARKGEVVRSELYQGGFEFGRRACSSNAAGIALDERVAEEPAAERAPLRWMVDLLVMTMFAPSTADLPKSGVRRVNRSFVCVLTIWRPCMGDAGVFCARAPSLETRTPHAVRLPPLG